MDKETNTIQNKILDPTQVISGISSLDDIKKLPEGWSTVHNCMHHGDGVMTKRLCARRILHKEDILHKNKRWDDQFYLTQVSYPYLPATDPRVYLNRVANERENHGTE